MENSEWRLSEQMTILKKFVNGNRPQAPVLHSEDNSSAVRDDAHPIEKFFSLMATTVKKFSQIDQHKVKRKVFAVVSEIEEKYLTSCEAHTVPTTSYADI